MGGSIYKNPEAKEAIFTLYDQKLASLEIEYEDIYIDTFAGSTHIIATGDIQNPPIVLMHGVNAGAPVALEAIKGLNENYRIYAIDSIGQTTKSAETRLDLKDDSYGKWLSEILDHLSINKAIFIGVSYGAFLVQKLMRYAPQKFEKTIFIVPGGLANGKFWESTRKLTFPLLKYMRTKKEVDLLQFLDAFYSEKDQSVIDLQKTLLTGVKMDYRRPPLVKKSDVKDLDTPVFAIFAENDVFFPMAKSLEQCQVIFKNFKGYYILKGSKHVPDKAMYSELEDQIKLFLTLGE